MACPVPMNTGLPGRVAAFSLLSLALIYNPGLTS